MRRWIGWLALTGLAACADEGSAPAGDAGADTGTDATADTHDATDGSLGDDVVSDATPDVPTGPCGGTGRTITLALSRITFGRIVDGVTPGLNLDDRVSDFRDQGGCGRPDVLGLDGTEGVDNAFGSVLPALEQIGGDAIEGLVQNAINDGELLLTVTLEGVDSVVDDACVVATVSRAAGLPDIGTDGLIEPGQTFDYHPVVPPVAVGETAIAAGQITAGTFSFRLPINFLGTNVLLTATDSFMRLELDEYGFGSGFISGGVPVAELITIANQVDFGDNTIGGVIRNLVPQFADLFPDDNGECQYLSVSLVFDAVPAFFYPDSVPASDEGSGEGSGGPAGEGSGG